MTINNIKYLDPIKNDPNDKIYWLTPFDMSVGEFLFSFDLKKVYNIYLDYPHNLSKEEKEIFDKENVFWFNYFK